MPILEIPWTIKPEPGTPLDPEKSADIQLFYPFNEGDGDTLDLSGEGNNGTLSAGTQWVYVGQFGKALEFRLSLGDTVTFDTALVMNDQHTFSIWIYTHTDLTARAICGDSTNNNNIALSSATQINVTDSGGDVLGFTVTTLVAATWHHIVLVRDGSNWYLYKDGEASSSNPISDADTLTIDRIGNGRSDVDFSWGGYLDVPIFWDRALTHAEIIDLFANTWHLMKPVQIPIGVAAAVAFAGPLVNAPRLRSTVGGGLV